MVNKKYFEAIMFGGAIGASQLSALCSFLAHHLALVIAAGWVVIIIPVGSLMGCIIAACLWWHRNQTFGPVSSFLLGWIFSIVFFFPASLVSPMLVVFNRHDVRHGWAAFFILYSAAWLFIYYLSKDACTDCDS